MLGILLSLITFTGHNIKLTPTIKQKIQTISARADEYRVKGETGKLNSLINKTHIKNIPYYTIEGKVYDNTLSPIIAGCYVYIYSAYTGDMVSTIYPDINGEYMDTLPMGAYVIQAKGDMYPTYYYTQNGGTGRIDSAYIVWLDSNRDSINFIIPDGNVIKGTLSDNSTSQPISNVFGSVALIDTVTKSVVWKPLATDTFGNYTIEGVNKGTFKVRYYPSGYMQTYYGDTYNWFNAQVLNFNTWGDTLLSINVSLPPTGSGPSSGSGVIMGMLLSDSGDTVKDPWPNATIKDANTGAYVFSTFSYDTTTGIYTFSDLPTGTYKIMIDPENYMPEWYNDKQDFESADPVSVTDGDTTRNIDFNLHRGGAIAGTITDTSGWGYGGAYYLDIYDSNTGDYVYGKFGGTLYDGSFSTGTDLSTGTYKAYMYPTDIGAGQWYKDATSFENADTITVTAPDTTYGINFDFYGWTGVIAGEVKNTSGEYIQATVDVYYANTNEYVSSATADSGRFSIQHLPEGNYKLYIEPWGTDSMYFLYMSQWYNGQDSWDNANTINLPQGDSVFVSVTLAEGGKIVGSITDSLTGTRISTSAYPFMPLFISQNNTKAQDGDITDFGTFSSYTMFAGDYRVLLIPQSYYDSTNTPPLVYNPYHFEFYDNSSTYQGATPISLQQDSIINININTVKVPGAIEGSVMNGPNPISGQEYDVVVINTEGYPVAVFSTTDTASYHVGGLLPGNYYVYLWPYGLWYNQVFRPVDIERVPYNIPDSASMITISNSTVSGINFDITGIEEQRNKGKTFEINMPTVLKGDILLVENTREINTIRVFDITGREIKNIKNSMHENRMSISFKGLKSGIYFVTFTNKGSTLNRKIIKVK